LTPHPKTEGVYGADATVGAYLDQQGGAPFFEMGDRYGVVYQRMIERLASLDANELQRRSSRRTDVEQTEPGLAASPWIDIDKTVSEFCKANGRPMPDDVEGTVAVHIEALETWVASLGH
jgi:hypothetical protein